MRHGNSPPYKLGTFGATRHCTRVWNSRSTANRSEKTKTKKGGELHCPIRPTPQHTHTHKFYCPPEPFPPIVPSSWSMLPDLICASPLVLICRAVFLSFALLPLLTCEYLLHLTSLPPQTQCHCSFMICCWQLTGRCAARPTGTWSDWYGRSMGAVADWHCWLFSSSLYFCPLPVSISDPLKYFVT
jgi:hypothetical protein